MSNTTETPTKINEPKRRGRFADFFIRLQGASAQLGRDLSREGHQLMEKAPWLALWPGLFLTVVVYCLNIFGDATRDLLDPRLRGGQGSYGVVQEKRQRGLPAPVINPFKW